MQAGSTRPITVCSPGPDKGSPRVPDQDGHTGLKPDERPPLRKAMAAVRTGRITPARSVAGLLLARRPGSSGRLMLCP
jgi:hypothetical protein